MRTTPFGCRSGSEGRGHASGARNSSAREARQPVRSSEGASLYGSVCGMRGEMRTGGTTARPTKIAKEGATAQGKAEGGARSAHYRGFLAPEARKAPFRAPSASLAAGPRLVGRFAAGRWLRALVEHRPRGQGRQRAGRRVGALDVRPADLREDAGGVVLSERIESRAAAVLAVTGLRVDGEGDWVGRLRIEPAEPIRVFDVELERGVAGGGIVRKSAGEHERRGLTSRLALAVSRIGRRAGGGEGRCGERDGDELRETHSLPPRIGSTSKRPRRTGRRSAPEIPQRR